MSTNPSPIHTMGIARMCKRTCDLHHISTAEARRLMDIYKSNSDEIILHLQARVALNMHPDDAATLRDVIKAYNEKQVIIKTAHDRHIESAQLSMDSVTDCINYINGIIMNVYTSTFVGAAAAPEKK